MNLKLPNSSYVNKFIAKSKFYERASLGTKLQSEFVNKIQKITWKYKLSEETIGVSKTDKVTEIQIFEIELKEKKIPQNVVKVIDKSIPYQILYIFSFNDNVAYGISLKENNISANFYFSEWNEDIQFDFSGIDLEKVYQKLIKAFLKYSFENKDDFNEVITIDSQLKGLEKEITSLENKIRKEKQFNRKVETNKLLSKKKKELKMLKRNLL